MRCGIALGSNLGDRLAYVQEGYARASRLHETADQILASSIYETSPIGCEPGTTPFLNAVIEIGFNGAPLSLLEQLLGIEIKMGRPPERPKNAPRAIDLDLLYAGNVVMKTPCIVLPHPGLLHRSFVLTPLAEIAPDLILPGQSEPVTAFLARLSDPGVVTRIPKLRLESE